MRRSLLNNQKWECNVLFTDLCIRPWGRLTAPTTVGRTRPCEIMHHAGMPFACFITFMALERMYGAAVTTRDVPAALMTT